jgi:hypothetical protein
MVSLKDKSVEELDSDRWGGSEYNSSLVMTCHRLRPVPLKNLTIEDLRLLLRQEIGLKYLFPMAIEHLEKNPFAQGNYPGDLLKNVLKVKC